MSVASVISVISQHAAQIDSAQVCQFQLADMAELADNQPPVNDRPERRSNECRMGMERGFSRIERINADGFFLNPR